MEPGRVAQHPYCNSSPASAAPISCTLCSLQLLVLNLQTVAVLLLIHYPLTAYELVFLAASNTIQPDKTVVHYQSTTR